MLTRRYLYIVSLCLLAFATGAASKPTLAPKTPTEAESVRDGYARGHTGHFTAWVQYTLTPARLAGSVPDRLRHFLGDERQPTEFRWTELDYVGQPWDVGHLCEAATARSDGSERDTFILTNTMPQNAALNRGQWARLEKYIRDRVKGGAIATVVTGPAFIPDSDSKTIRIATIGKHRLWVPTHCWKAALITESGETTAQAWLIPNERLDEDFDEFAVSVSFVTG